MRPRPRVGTRRRLRRVARRGSQAGQQALHRRELVGRAGVERLCAQQRLGAVARRVALDDLAFLLDEAPRARAGGAGAPHRQRTIGGAPLVARRARPGRPRRRSTSASKSSPNAVRVARADLERDREGAPDLRAVAAGPRGRAPPPRRSRRARLARTPRSRRAAAKRARWTTRSPSLMTPAPPGGPPRRAPSSSAPRQVLQIVAVLQDAAQRLLRPSRRRARSRCRRTSACAQSIVSAAPGDFRSLRPRSACTNRPISTREALAHSRHAGVEDADLLFEARGARCTGRGSAGAGRRRSRASGWR